MSKWVKSFALVAFIAGPTAAEPLGLGRVATPEEIAAWDIDVRPDGQGLPEGQGNALDGEEIFNEECASCHGVFGEGEDRWPQLVGGFDTLTEDRPVKTVGSYWPYASTVFDYVHRAMPFGNAQSLSDDDVYAITAYILYMNDVIEDDEFVLSKATFTEIEMPNVGGFTEDARPDTPTIATSEPCMRDCFTKPLEVTMRARVLDVTPESDEATTDEGEVVKVEPAVAAFDAELAAKGEKVFTKCQACHQVGEKAKNRTGPALNGVIGKEAGAVEKYRYSKAMKIAAAEGLIWSEETLGWYLEAPRKYMKGTKMSFKGLRDESDRAAVIEYLKQFE